MEMSDRKPIDEVLFLDDEAQNFLKTIETSLTGRDNVGVVLSQITTFLAAEASSVFVLDEATGDLVLQYATGEVGDEIVGLRLGADQGVVGWVVKYCEDLIVPYPGMDARFFDGVDESTGFSTSSILCCPMRTGVGVIGAVEVLNKVQGTFNDDDLILLRAVARLLARVV